MSTPDKTHDFGDVHETEFGESKCYHDVVQPFVDLPDDELLSMEASEVRRRFPRFQGYCPRCRKLVTLYASNAHYIAGDW